MIVTVPVDFEVSTSHDGLEKRHAQEAAEYAVENFLSFVRISGYTSDTDEVEAHVDGFGECVVKLLLP